MHAGGGFCAASHEDMTSPSLSRSHIISRIGAGLFGSYTFVWGFTTLGIALGVLGGMGYGQAQTLVYLLAFLLFLVCFCWAFAAARLVRVWTVLAGGGLVMTAVAWLLSRTLS
jgi:hypothetical protein